MEFPLVELQRRLENLIRYGTVAELDETLGLIRVQSGNLYTTWIRWLTMRAGPDKTWWAPEEGERVLLLCPSGDPANAIALPAINTTGNPQPANQAHVHRVQYADGTVMEYDREAHRLQWDIGGSLIEATPDGITLASNGATLELKEAGAYLDGQKVYLG